VGLPKFLLVCVPAPQDEPSRGSGLGKPSLFTELGRRTSKQHIKPTTHARISFIVWLRPKYILCDAHTMLNCSSCTSTLSQILSSEAAEQPTDWRGTRDRRQQLRTGAAQCQAPSVLGLSWGKGKLPGLAVMLRKKLKKKYQWRKFYLS